MTRISPYAAALVAGVLLPSPGCTAFTRAVGRFSATNRKQALSATIYEAEGDGRGVEVSSSWESYSSPWPSQSFATNRATLARVAAAFPPPGHALNINDIYDVQVVLVNAAHLELQTVVCEHESCATIAVPITLPHPCLGAHVEQCVLENLGELDGAAQQRLEQLQYEHEHREERTEQQRRHQELLASPTTNQLPYWWKAPGAMAAECDGLRALLNDDEFQAEVRGMARLALQKHQYANYRYNGDQSSCVQEVAVTAVGPVGMCLRARMQQHQDTNSVMMDILIPFRQEAVGTAQLRELVIQELDRVQTRP